MIVSMTRATRTTVYNVRQLEPMGGGVSGMSVEDTGGDGGWGVIAENKRQRKG